MPEFQNRTLICSVLFADIVEYSRKSVIEQGQLKDRFNAFLSEALRGVAINDRIILDTGDGAAISFIGDPEDALFVATELRDVIATLPEDTQPLLSTRMGINLGPVRLVKDINGQPNIIGDGINVAQRVMTFARPGQVLVSRSYYEVVSRLSDESSKLFSYEGARTDKHIREHEVYAVGSFPGARKRFEAAISGDWSATSGGTRPPALARASETVKRAAGGIARKPRLATGLAVLGILAIALGARSYRHAEEPFPVTQQAAAPAPKAEPAPPPPAEPEKPLPPIKGLPPEPQLQLQQEITVVPPPPAEKKPVKEHRAREESRKDAVAQAPRPAPPPEEAAPPPAPAVVSFAIAPWGEVYMDGKMLGVSPPLQDLEVPAGRHRIELRNAASQPHVITINAKPGERIRIKHKFN